MGPRADRDLAQASVRRRFEDGVQALVFDRYPQLVVAWSERGLPGNSARIDRMTDRVEELPEAWTQFTNAASEQHGLASYYRDIVRPLLTMPRTQWPRC